MKRSWFYFVIIIFGVFPTSSYSQSEDPPRIELAAEFTTMSSPRDNDSGLVTGFGPRFTFNLNKNFAIDTSMYLFARDTFSGGHNGQFVAGLKAGKRYKSWGIFAKARPGVVYVANDQIIATPTGQPALPFQISFKSTKNFATDLGAVVEFYPSRRIVTRFDVGDTLIHFGRRTNNFVSFDSMNNPIVIPFTTQAKTTHNFQLSASVGFRFW